MAGGLMSLVSQGQQNIILNGNPSKTFFKTTYAKFTNFGLQKFRVDYEGSKTLQLTEDSTFVFKIPRYADLLMDTYLSIDMPTIWSPLFPPPADQTNCQQGSGRWAPYEFKWIENLGAQMIRQVQVTCGNQTLQTFSGAYLLSCVQRDFSGEKKGLFDKMTGHVPELNDPANAGARVNSYPNAFYTPALSGPEPSIRGRTLYIPLNCWFGLKSQMAFPLVALQYNELQISITFRPINELFQIRDVMDTTNDFPYVAPNFNLYYMQMYRFLQPPPDIQLGIGSYLDTRSVWNANINLNCTYCFLSNDEARLFALNEQKYLFKQPHEQVFYNVTGANKVEVNSLSMVANYMFYLQRSDVNLRNEWSNYTNWSYGYMPQDIMPATTEGVYPVQVRNICGSCNAPNSGGPACSACGSFATCLTCKLPSGSNCVCECPAYYNYSIGPGVNPDGNPTGFFITGQYNPQNEKDILTNMAILFDGEYRENMQPAGVYNFIEKYTRTAGNAPDGLYCYQFCLTTSPYDLQPSGATNMSRFSKIEFEFNTLIPAVNPLAQTLSICDPATGEIIGINKPSWQIYDYNFNLVVMEERINMVVFVGGNAGLLYAS